MHSNTTHTNTHSYTLHMHSHTKFTQHTFTPHTCFCTPHTNLAHHTPYKHSHTILTHLHNLYNAYMCVHRCIHIMHAYYILSQWTTHLYTIHVYSHTHTTHTLWSVGSLLSCVYKTKYKEYTEWELAMCSYMPVHECVNVRYLSVHMYLWLWVHCKDACVCVKVHIILMCRNALY